MQYLKSIISRVPVMILESFLSVFKAPGYLSWINKSLFLSILGLLELGLPRLESFLGCFLNESAVCVDCLFHMKVSLSPWSISLAEMPINLVSMNTFELMHLVYLQKLKKKSNVWNIQRFTTAQWWNTSDNVPQIPDLPSFMSTFQGCSFGSSFLERSN